MAKKFEKYISLIQKDFPEFFISFIKKIGEGDNSKAFLVNKNYIFRFPKRKIVKQQIQREICGLPKIKKAIVLSIPEFEFTSPELNFVGYQKINGDILSNTIFISLSKNQQQVVQKQLGNFLTQIHSFLLDDLKDCKLEIMDLKEEYSENFSNAQKLIFPDISKNKQEIITHLFTEYLNNPENFTYTPVLVHNDFSKDHILFDKETERVTGIIDFGDIAFSDPDYDFLYLLNEFGEDFLNGVLK
ncbi:MAG: aminoglycoside phosphotransferase family protein, partial [Ginsengibacter sp.]